MPISGGGDLFVNRTYVLKYVAARQSERIRSSLLHTYMTRDIVIYVSGLATGVA